MKNANVWIAILVVLVVALFGAFKPTPINKIVERVMQEMEQARGLVHNVLETFDEGIAVDGDLVVTGDGGFITRGKVYAFGETGSPSITGELLCQGRDSIAYNYFTVDADGYDDGTWASLSFDDDETITAIGDCIENRGDMLEFKIDPISSTAAAWVAFVEPGFELGYASTQPDDEFSGGHLITVEVVNMDGSSLSWTIDVVEASVSFQP